MAPTGVLLINLGTPDDTSVPAVRRYLREFLSDPYVLDINPIARFLLLELVILRTRPQKSAEAYRQIWTDRGSPLRFHSDDLCEGVRAELGQGYRVALAMRYQNPSIEQGIAELCQQGCESIVVFPLYPQYTLSSTITCEAAVRRAVAKHPNPPKLNFVPAFYNDSGFIDAFAERGQTIIDAESPDHVLFSFHGIPERHIHKCDPSGSYCFAQPDCCANITDKNENCYRAQCYATAKALAQRHGLAQAQWSVAFQSRLGRTKWVDPYTDHEIPKLAAAGVRKLMVYCPTFVADCLETLEEIEIREAESFKEAGGESLHLVPSLNATASWCHAVAELARRHDPAAG